MGSGVPISLVNTANPSAKGLSTLQSEPEMQLCAGGPIHMLGTPLCAGGSFFWGSLHSELELIRMRQEKRATPHESPKQRKRINCSPGVRKAFFTAPAPWLLRVCSCCVQRTRFSCVASTVLFSAASLSSVCFELRRQDPPGTDSVPPILRSLTPWYHRPPKGGIPKGGIRTKNKYF